MSSHRTGVRALQGLLVAGAVVSGFYFSMSCVQDSATPPTIVEARTLTLAWQPGDAEPIDGFRVYRAWGDCPVGDLPARLDRGVPVEVTGLEYVDTLEADVVAPVCYEVTAFNAAGESLHSERAVWMGGS